MIARARRAFSLIELLVVIGIISVVMSMLVPAVQKTRESSSRIRCANHLRQLGIAIYSYHDALGVLPDNRDLARPPIYWRLISYVEQTSNNGTVPAELFLCPSRRTTAAGAKDDYACGWSTGSNLTFLNMIVTDQAFDITLSMVNRGDGCSNTLMLMHKGMPPQFYYQGIQPPNASYPPDYFNWYDAGWAGALNTAADAFRSPFVHLRDSNADYDIPYFQSMFMPLTPCYFIMSSAHPEAAPSLFGDGSVRMMSYTKNYGVELDYNTYLAIHTPETAILTNLWNFIDGNAIPASAMGQ